MKINHIIHNWWPIFFLKSLFRKYPSKYVSPKVGYNLIAQKYQSTEFNLFNFLDLKILSNYFKSKTTAKQVILDYGCGTGWKIALLNQFQFEKICVCDISDEMLNICVIQFPDLTKITLAKGQKIELPENSVHFITCNLVLGYVKNLKLLFQEWNRILKPNGEIIITDIHEKLNPTGKNRNFLFENQNLIISSYPYHFQHVKAALSDTSLTIIEAVTHKLGKQYQKEIPEKVFRNFENKEVLYSLVIRKN